jgi:hypothetical protein
VVDGNTFPSCYFEGGFRAYWWRYLHGRGDNNSTVFDLILCSIWIRWRCGGNGNISAYDRYPYTRKGGPEGSGRKKVQDLDPMQLWGDFSGI